MKKKISSDFIFTLIGVGYVLFALFPLIKSLFFNKNNVTYGNKEEWVEVPLIAEE
jgi:hypothetical protein